MRLDQPASDTRAERAGTPAPASRRKRAIFALLLAAAAIAALVPRVANPTSALTIDEALWIDRSRDFADAVFDARFGDAYSTGHPGVTTMWIGGLAQRTLPRDADLLDRYGRARIAMGVAAVGLLVAVFLLARRLAGTGPAAAGAALLAFDPFVVANNRVLHLDGLLALTMAASVLALLAGRRNGSDALLRVSGVFAALAFLTKTPAAVLLGVAFVVLRREPWRRRLQWLVPAAITGLALWPYLWVAPHRAIGLMAAGAGAAAAGHEGAGFFLGSPTDAPNPLFYPVVFLWRSSIFTLPALVAATVWAWRRRASNDHAASALRLVAVALAFMAFATVAGKKGDRYLLPSFALADLAVGFAAATWLARVRRPALVAGVAAAGLALHAAPALALHPFENAHYNWLVGGPKTATSVLTVGWGEGLQDAAAALNRMPDAGSLTVATTRVTQFEEFFAGRTVRIQDSALMKPGGPEPDLVLFYFSSVQAQRFDAAWRAYRDRTPVYRLDVNGIPYVRVYEGSGDR